MTADEKLRHGATRLDIAIEGDLVFYGLQAKPFEPGADPRFLWLGARHREGLSRLAMAIRRYSGPVVLAGEPGVGKTMLAKALIDGLGETVAVASIGHSRLDPLQFFRLVARAYRLDTTVDSREALAAEFERFLVEARRADRKVLLVLDEAQTLPHELFAEVRRLSGIAGRDPDTASDGVLSVLMVGQNALAGPLRDSSLAQRVVLRWVVEPLAAGEVDAYIAHRLKVAGSARNPFNAEAVHEVWALSGGSPRLVNALCARALVLGGRAMAMGRRCASLTIGPDLVREAANGLRASDAGPRRVEPARRNMSGAGRAASGPHRRRTAAIATALTLLALTAAVAGYVRSTGQPGRAVDTDVAAAGAESDRDAQAPEPPVSPLDGPAARVSGAAEPAADRANPGPVVTAPVKRLPASARAGKQASRRDVAPPVARVRPAERVRAPRAAPPARPAVTGRSGAERRATPAPQAAPVKDDAAEPDPTAVIDWLLDEYAGSRR